MAISLTQLPTANSLDRSTLGLYALIVWCWGTSWYALHLQLGVVPPEVALVWRFIGATLAMFLWCLIDRTPLAFPLAAHGRFALQGLLLFSSNFLLFYYGGAMLHSGLLAVVFSTASIINLMLGAAFFGQKLEIKVAMGALLGFSGIALIFWPEITTSAAGFDQPALLGLGLCLAGTLSFCLGNFVSASNQKLGLPIKSSNAWGMLYGVVWLAFLAFVQGKPFIFDFSLRYVGSLIYLVIFSTVIAFWTYLTLLGRVGAARAGYATVLFPILALAVSSLLENYQWSTYAIGGIALVALGNVLVLRR
jgi:drug/metabolite transporter (DMT)-like permease